MLDLVRLSARRFHPVGGEELYRQVALLAGLREGMELLDVGCGRGVALEYFVREWGVHGTGVDPDESLVAQAEAYARSAGLSARTNFQEASPADLPFRDETFDVVVGEVGLGIRADPRQAVAEMVRVLRPGGRIALIQLVWTGAVAEERKGILAEHLGARPLMTVELRRALLEMGVRELHAEDWGNPKGGTRSGGPRAFPDFAEFFSLGEKLEILRKAWRRWGWTGARALFQREAEVHRLLSRERILGLSLLMGVKAGSGSASVPPEDEGRGEHAGLEEVHPAVEDHDGDLQTAGLPLFSGSGEDARD